MSLILVPFMTTAEAVEKACHHLAYYKPGEERLAVAEGILRATHALAVRNVIDIEKAGQYKKIALDAKRAAELFIKTKEAECQTATLPQPDTASETPTTLPSSPSGSETSGPLDLTASPRTEELPSISPTQPLPPINRTFIAPSGPDLPSIQGPTLPATLPRRRVGRGGSGD